MDLEAKKKVLRNFTYGLYILTAQDGEEVAAGTVNWVTQASFQPPSSPWGSRRKAASTPSLSARGSFAS
jgi:flavin reductase (DIM6/NTAB) family NADH-FMN oxidoreductase RutF